LVSGNFPTPFLKLKVSNIEVWDGLSLLQKPRTTRGVFSRNRCLTKFKFL